jgi:hypothetical protein
MDLRGLVYSDDKENQMARRFFSKKRIKKINRSLSNPAVRYVGGGLLSLVAVGALRVLSEKFPAVREIFRKDDSVRRSPDEGGSRQIQA